MAAHKQTIFTASEKETKTLGINLGNRLTPGVCLCLFGDLGTGKTVFVQGLAKGLGVPDRFYVTSPTYTLINEYPGKMILFHVDLYRLENNVDIESLGLLDIFYSNQTVAVEWSERLNPLDLPENRIDLYFSFAGPKERKIKIIAYGLGSADLVKQIAD